MGRVKHLSAVLACLGLALASQVPGAASGPTPLVIGVDHADPANQQPQNGRVFEYTDFFSRSVAIHSGDTINFRSAPGSFHVVALATSERAARAAYPVAYPDVEGTETDIAPGSGTAKLLFGVSNFPITGGCDNSQCSPQIAFNNGFGPPVCGVPTLGQSPCTFAGGHDVEVFGPEVGIDFTKPGFPPTFVDQLVNITAPLGTYAYFCYIHPGMRGTLKVVGSDRAATTQAQIDSRSQADFLKDQAQGLAAERRANHVSFTGDDPGSRVYKVQVGIAAADNHVGIDEMLPTMPLRLAPGDQVHYVWRDPHNVHSVAFPTGSSTLPQPFGFDCGATYSGITPGAPIQPCFELNEPFEVVGDPGNAPPGAALTDPTALVNAGVRVGTGYGVKPSSQDWLVSAGTAGTYRYQCTIHDWMQGTITIRAESED
jgi:plastocyanin